MVVVLTAATVEVVTAAGTVVVAAAGSVVAPAIVVVTAPGIVVVSRRPLRLRDVESDDPPQAERAMSAIESREARSFIKVQTLKRKWTKCTEVHIGCQVCVTDQIPQAV